VHYLVKYHGLSSGEITAISTAILAIITIYYAWQTRKQVELLEKERKARDSKELSEKFTYI